MAMPSSSNPAVRSLADEAGTDALPDEGLVDPALAGAAAVPEGPPVVRSITPPTVAPLPNQATFAAHERAGAAEDEVLPTNNSLIANGTNLPDMKLDIHVYSAKPAERFVFVNMRKYVEGQSLAEGPVVERITPDGAILNQHGTRFLLPRQ
jgi:general secretion pathway protein B